MNRDSVAWKGYWVAAPTPFARDGTVDEPALRKLLRHYQRKVSTGSSSMAPRGNGSLSRQQERKRGR